MKDRWVVVSTEDDTLMGELVFRDYDNGNVVLRNASLLCLDDGRRTLSLPAMVFVATGKTEDSSVMDFRGAADVPRIEVSGVKHVVWMTDEAAAAWRDAR